MRVVLVLGGGGAKSLAHAGAWKALQETGAEIVHIVGTSMGAVMGAAFAAGSTDEHVLRIAGALSQKDVASLDYVAVAKGLFATSILKTRALERTIARLVPAEWFAQLATPLTVTATDLDSGELMLFGALGADVPLRDALYASCALPLYFAPAHIDGRRLADGGLRAVLPLSVAARIPADLVVAIDVGPGFDEPLPLHAARSRLAPPIVRAHGEAIRIMMAAQTQQGIEDWPHTAPRLVVIRAVAEREATFATGQAERYFAAGYRTTKQEMQKARRIDAQR